MRRLLIFIATCFVVFTIYSIYNKDRNIPLVAIANYGPHSTLDDTIAGFKDEMAELGYVEGQNIRYKILDVNFETSLIPQMIRNIYSLHPKIVVTVTTPVGQSAKTYIDKDSVPVVALNVTDPEAAGLGEADDPFYVVSDMLDMTMLVNALQERISGLDTIGMLYSSGEANDVAAMKQLTDAASAENIAVLSVPVEHSRDAKMRLSVMKNRANVIYVGSSGVVQSAISAINQFAKNENIPIVNFDQEASSDNAHHIDIETISYKLIGATGAKIVDRILQDNIADLPKIILPKNIDDI